MPKNVTVVPSITGMIKTEFLKKQFVEGKLVNSLPCHAESSSIEMLIGNDHCFDLLEPRKMDLGGGLFFHSKLGWILGGRVEQPSDKIDKSSLLLNTVGFALNGIKSEHCWIYPEWHQVCYSYADKHRSFPLLQALPGKFLEPGVIRHC